MSSKCSSCGGGLIPSERFCHSCGSLAPSLRGPAPASPTASKKDPEVTPPSNTPRVTTTPEAHAENRRRRGALISVSTVIGVALVAGVIALATGRDSTSTSREFVEQSEVVSDAAETAQPVETSPPMGSTSDVENSTEWYTSDDVSDVVEDDTSSTFDDQTATSGNYVAEAYVNALASWSSAGFESMLELSQEGSPAWAYGYHLFLGRYSERQAGGGDGRPLEVLSDGSTYRICFTAACSAEISNFVVEGDRVRTFDVNGRPLADSINIHPFESDFVCGQSGFCVALRSTFWFGGTTYSIVEVSVSDPSVKKVRSLSVKLETIDGAQYSMTSGTTPTATPVDNAVYSIGFRDSPDPRMGYVVVKLRSSLGTETIRLAV